MSRVNKELAHRFHMDIFQDGNLELADELVTADFAWRGGMAPPQEPCGPDGVKAVAEAVISAFPDREIVHHDELAEGDKVLIRWTMSGTQQGELQGIPPTGKRVTVTGFDLFRVSGGKITDLWQEVDQLSMLQQLGALPAPDQAAG